MIERPNPSRYFLSISLMMGEGSRQRNSRIEQDLAKASPEELMTLKTVGSTVGCSKNKEIRGVLFRVFLILFVIGIMAKAGTALTGFLSPNPTVGVRNTNVVGTASPGAAV